MTVALAFISAAQFSVQARQEVMTFGVGKGGGAGEEGRMRSTLSMSESDETFFSESTATTAQEE